MHRGLGPPAKAGVRTRLRDETERVHAGADRKPSPPELREVRSRAVADRGVVSPEVCEPSDGGHLDSLSDVQVCGACLPPIVR